MEEEGGREYEIATVGDMLRCVRPAAIDSFLRQLGDMMREWHAIHARIGALPLESFTWVDDEEEI